MFAFTGVGVRGLIVESLEGVDVTDKSEAVKKVQAVVAALWALCKQPVLCRSPVPTAKPSQKQLTLPCLLSSPDGISLNILRGLTFPRKDREIRSPSFLPCRKKAMGHASSFIRTVFVELSYFLTNRNGCKSKTQKK